MTLSPAPRRCRNRPQTAPPRHRAGHVGVLESRLLLSTTSLPVVNPDFAEFFKPGSTTVTAIVPADDLTDGLGPNVPVVAFGGGQTATVNYSDGTAGTAVDVPGWTAPPASPFSPPTRYVGVLGTATSPTQPPPAGTFANALIVGGYADGEQFTQTLAGVALRPRTTYVLSVASTARANGQRTPPDVLIGLEVGGVPLTPTSMVDPGPSGANEDVVSGTYTRTYVADATPPAGPVTIVLGTGPGDVESAQSVNFTAVRLTATDAAPAVSLAAPRVTAAGGRTEAVTATFTSADVEFGIDPATIAVSDLVVTGPGGRVLAVTGVTANPASGSPATVTATFTVAAPAGGWSAADNGTYTVSLAAGAVADAAGNTTAAAAATFAVSVLPTGVAAGAPDPTFAPATGGRVGLGFFANATVVAPNGSILVAGQQPAPGGGTRAVLERLTADGTPDATFGTGGIVTAVGGGSEIYYGVLPLADGRVLAAGTSGGSLLLARYNPDGTPDSTFGTAGRVVAAVGGAADAAAYALALDPAGGGIVLGGSAGGQFLAARYTTAGAADPGFNGGQPLLFGTADADVIGNLAVRTDGTIVAAGASGTRVAVARVTAGGAVDTTFNAAGASPGVVVLDDLVTQVFGAGVPDATEALAIDPQGKILVANRTADGRFGVVRLTADGARDAAFGTGGLAATDFGGDDDADFVGVTADGARIFVAGTTTAGGVTQTAVAAYTAAGALDPAFGTGGTTLLPFGLATPAALRAGPAADGFSPQSAGGSILGQMKRVVAALADGVLLVMASQQDAGTGGDATAATSLARLVAADVPAPLPSGTLGVAVAGTLPASVVGGAKAKASVRVTVTNPTTQPVAGPVTVSLFVSPSAALGGATKVRDLTTAVKLKAGKSKTLTLKVSSFPSVSAGTYTLLATAQGPDGTITGAAGPAVAIAPPFVTVTVSGVRPAAAAAPGKAVSLDLVLTNSGNIPAAGTPTLALTAAASAPATGTIPLATLPLRVKLKAGQVLRRRVKFVLPANLAPGSYALTATLGVAALGDAVPADGVAAAETPLVVG